MPLYEYRCSTCDATFELRRPAAQSQDPAVCANGHAARRVLSLFAMASSGPSPASGMAEGPVMGCGPNCACAAGH